MQRVVIDEPYEFVPPIHAGIWSWMLRFILPGYLRRAYGVVSVECRHAERLKKSLAAGHSIILAPNHSREADPIVLGMLAIETGCYLYAMASWHAFKQSRFQTFMIRRMGAFSVLREGNDRQAIDMAIQILLDAKRPLILFPEGALSRHGDLLEELMDGPSFIARQAARKLEKSGSSKKVVIHPIVIRYAFTGDLRRTVEPVITARERQLSWQPQRHLSLVDRLAQIGSALLTLKEIEFTGQPGSGELFDRAQALIDEELARLEADWDIRDSSGSPVARVKRIRTAIVPTLINGKLSESERDRRWRDLAAAYYVQQISHYPRGYLQKDGNLPERIVETVERLEEDFSDVTPRFTPFRATIEVGEPISLGSHRERGAPIDPIMTEVRRQLEDMLGRLLSERLAELKLRHPEVEPSLI
jgi:1-acyl-sn-glycerol-3-phosphate acyltransferase